MFRWIPYAMVRVAVFFVGGIAFAIRFPLTDLTQTLSVVAVIVVAYVTLRIFWRNNFLFGPVGLAAIFLLGYIRVQVHTSHNDPRHFKYESFDFYKIIITRYSEEKGKTWRTEAEVVSVHSDSGWRAKTGRVLLYFSKEDFTIPFHYGDELLIRGSPILVNPSSNPGEFDMQRHLFFKNIYHRHSLDGDHVKLIGSGGGNTFISSAITVRLWADNQLKTYVPGDRERATASALVLGVTDGLDDDLLQAYASTGAMHVLAVSGLHVSIIYWIILLAGKPLEKLKSGKVILAVGSVVILWIYAFVTGWSPSVLRAVMMFTFVALARPWRQSTNIYNTMAASAFCLLVYDPFFLMSVGFQLSYIAVFGIVFLHPHLYLLWEPRRRIWDEVWKVTSVSIAAQAATVPISLFYFHQFPNYFLIANLLVIPASFVVLVAGLAILPLSIVPVIASAAGFALGWVIYLMNQIVIIIGSLPFALIENIYVDSTQSWLLAAATLTVVLCLVERRLSWLWASLIFVIAFSAIDWIHLFTVVDRSHITLYNIRGRTAIDFIHRGKLLTYGDSIPAFQTAANRVRLGVKNEGSPMPVVQRSGCSVISWSGLDILIIRSPEFTPPNNLEVDMVVLANNATRSIPQIKCNKVIIDSSNSFYLAERLVGAANNEQQTTNSDFQPVRKGFIHSVFHHGAYQYSF
jgi:competence protein ComEC